jgi:hypothetical protein
VETLKYLLANVTAAELLAAGTVCAHALQRALLHANPLVADAAPQNGNTVLHFAALAGADSLVDLLLSKLQSVVGAVSRLDSPNLVSPARG